MSSHFEQLCQTIATLRGPEGCPWDREQTYKSLTRYLIEEAYEVLDAINTDDFEKLKGELGDLLLQIVLQAQLAQEHGHFDIEEVAKAINEKMIARHPHVFSNTKVQTSEEVLAQWEELKEAERLVKGKTHSKNSYLDNTGKSSALTGVPEGMPALLKALKISEKAVNRGFEWEKEEDIWAQLDSELEEFRQETHKENGSVRGIDTDQIKGRKRSVASDELYLEMGDVLFTMVNLARWHKIDPEEALLLAIEKFKKRFQLMEEKANHALKKMTVSQLEELWRQVKEDLKKEKLVKQE
jgi:tetrapyrrole methylase family protein/MazG family protein